MSSTASSFAARLKDPALLRDMCYIDGAWVGTVATVVTNPVNLSEIAKVRNFGAKETTQAVEAAEKAFPLGPSSAPSSAPTSRASGSS
jgi:succinate-semialdehyde dehydrogenase/glutarate-semialdehyde dehydrogenase